MVASGADQRGCRGDAAGDAERAVDGGVRRAVLHGGLDRERGAALQVDIAGRGQRGEVRQGERRVGRDGAAGVGRVPCRSTSGWARWKTTGRSGVSSVASAVIATGACSNRPGHRAGDAQALDAGLERDPAAVALHVGREVADGRAAGGEAIEAERARCRGPGERAVNVRVERHGLPGDIGCGASSRARRRSRRGRPRGHRGRPCPWAAACSGPAAMARSVAAAFHGPATCACTSSAPRSGSFASVATSPCAGSRASRSAARLLASMCPLSV